MDFFEEAVVGAEETTHTNTGGGSGRFSSTVLGTSQIWLVVFVETAFACQTRGYQLHQYLRHEIVARETTGVVDWVTICSFRNILAYDTVKLVKL